MDHQRTKRQRKSGTASAARARPPAVARRRRPSPAVLCSGWSGAPVSRSTALHFTGTTLHKLNHTCPHCVYPRGGQLRPYSSTSIRGRTAPVRCSEPSASDRASPTSCTLRSREAAHGPLCPPSVPQEWRVARAREETGASVAPCAHPPAILVALAATLQIVPSVCATIVSTVCGCAVHAVARAIHRKPRRRQRGQRWRNWWRMRRQRRRQSWWRQGGTDCALQLGHHLLELLDPAEHIDAIQVNLSVGIRRVYHQVAVAVRAVHVHFTADLDLPSDERFSTSA